MNKLILFALQSKFPADTLDALVEVIEATPNAEVAAMILMGLYELPTLPLTRKTHPDSKSTTIIGLVEMVGYDKFKDRVDFKYTATSDDTRFFETQELADACKDYDQATNGYGDSRVSNSSKDGKWQFPRTFHREYAQTSYCRAETWAKA